jgi:Ohr subfamily peroxiredoxin
MQTLYTAQATAVGGRDGHVETADGLLKVDMSMPKSLGGPGRPQTTNPEQLFAMGYAACFGGAVGFVAKMQKIEVGAIAVTADVHIGKVEPAGLGLGVALSVRVPGVSREVAESLVRAAHEVCPYSKATRGNIEVTLAVID